MVPSKYKRICTRLGPCGKSSSLQGLLESTKKNWCIHPFFFEIINFESIKLWHQHFSEKKKQKDNFSPDFLIICLYIQKSKHEDLKLHGKWNHKRHFWYVFNNKIVATVLFASDSLPLVQYQPQCMWCLNNALCDGQNVCAQTNVGTVERHLLIPLRVSHLLLLDPSLECAMIIQLVTGDRSILKSAEICCFSCEGWQKKHTELYIHFYFKTKPGGCLLIMMKENTIMFKSIHPNTKQCQSFTVDYILKCP